MVQRFALLLAACLAVLATACASAPKPDAETIFVGSPEILTRERLVNDRLRQEDWLEEQLEKSDEAEFAPQGLTDVRSFFGFSAQAEVEANPNVLALNAAEASTELAKARRQEELNSVQHRIDVLKKLNQLEKLQGGDNSLPTLKTLASTEDAGSDDDDTGDDDGGDDTEDDGGGGEDSGGGGEPVSPGLSPDLDGFIDRLEQASGLLPSGKPEVSRAKVSPIEEFRDRLALREEIRQELLENALDDRHDLRGNTLYRMSLDATVLPPAGLDAWAVVDFTVEGWRSEGDKPDGSKAAAARTAFLDQWRQGVLGALDGRSSLPRMEELNSLPDCWDEPTKTQLSLALEAARVEKNESQASQLALKRFFGLLAIHTRNAALAVPTALPDDCDLADFEPTQCVKTGRRALLRAELAKARLASSEHTDSSRGRPDYGWDELYERWVTHLERKVNSLYQIRRRQARGCDVPCSGVEAPAEEDFCDEEVSCRLSQQDLLELVQEAARPELCGLPMRPLDIVQEGNRFDFWNNGQITEGEFRLESLDAQPGSQDRKGLKTDLHSAITCLSESPVFSCNNKRQAALDLLLAHQLRTQLLETWGLEDYISISEPSCGRPAVQIKTPSLQSLKLDAFVHALAQQERVYAHSATPKESTQRISAVAARSSSFQAALGLSMLFNVAQVDSAAELIQQSQSLLEDISRPPLVVGFTKAGVSSASAADFSRKAEAGWILGPKFEIETKRQGFFGGEKPYAAFSHLPMQNSLSANISLPSWWEAAKVTTQAKWVAKDGTTMHEDAKRVHNVSLPGRLQDITNSLARSREPIVFGFQTFDVTHGAKTQLLIDGWNLWRSSRVTLGGQISDRITVLPNMGGIVASFDNVAEPLAPGGKLREDVPVYVWTSEGYRLAGRARIHPGKTKPPAKLTLALTPPRLVTGQPVRLKIASASLPKQRNDMDLVLRPWIGQEYGEPVLLEEVEYTEDKKLLTAALPNPKPGTPANTNLWPPGTEVRVELQITQKERGDISTVPADGLAIYFGSEALKMTVDKGASTSDPIRLATPKNMARAFPDFAELAKVEIQVKNQQFSYELENTSWKTDNDGRLVLQTKLKGVNLPATFANGTEIELSLKFAAEPLSKLLTFDPVKLKFASP